MNYNKYSNNRKKITMNEIATGKTSNAPSFPGKIFKQDEEGIIKKVDDGIVTPDGNTTKSPFQLINPDSVTDFIKKAEEHNARLSVIDPEFSEKFEMHDDYILLRMEMEVNKRNSGLLTSVPMISVPKKSGAGHERIPRNYPFTTKGIVVNINPKLSERINIKVKDYVIVEPNIISEVPLPGTEKTYLPNAFVHPNQVNMNASQTFGYVLCKPYQIQAKYR